MKKLKKRLCGFLFTALLTMAVLGGCADGTGESSGDNSSVESGKVPQDSGSAQDSGDAAQDSDTSAEESISQESTSEAGQAGQETPTDQYGGSLVVGIQQDMDSLDPHKATAGGTKEIIFNIF